MFYVLHEKSLLVLKALLLLPVKHAQIHLNIFHSKDTTRRGTIARDFLDHFSKTAAQIIFASCRGTQIFYTIVLYCMFLHFTTCFTVPRPNLGHVKLFLTLGNGSWTCLQSQRALEIPEQGKCGQKSVTTDGLWQESLGRCEFSSLDKGWDLIWLLHDRGWTPSKNYLH